MVEEQVSAVLGCGGSLVCCDLPVVPEPKETGTHRPCLVPRVHVKLQAAVVREGTGATAHKSLLASLIGEELLCPF